MSWFKKNLVLVPVDFSDYSCAAVDAALQMVDDATHLHVINVLSVLAATEPGVVWDTVSDETRRENCEAALRERFEDEKYQGIHFAVAFGDPGQEITAYAQRIGAELIVLPSHGRTGLKHLLIGSVAERVCRLSHCPVLVLRD
jgi:nucleotide-binding universal stress UspA family protein